MRHSNAEPKGRIRDDLQKNNRWCHPGRITVLRQGDKCQGRDFIYNLAADTSNQNGMTGGTVDLQFKTSGRTQVLTATVTAMAGNDAMLGSAMTSGNVTGIG
jgi:hypothetical protein